MSNNLSYHQSQYRADPNNVEKARAYIKALEGASTISPSRLGRLEMLAEALNFTEDHLLLMQSALNLRHIEGFELTYNMTEGFCGDVSFEEFGETGNDPKELNYIITQVMSPEDLSNCFEQVDLPPSYASRQENEPDCLRYEFMFKKNDAELLLIIADYSSSIHS